jgi:hypothetical protein
MKTVSSLSESLVVLVHLDDSLDVLDISTAGRCSTPTIRTSSSYYKYKTILVLIDTTSGKFIPQCRVGHRAAGEVGASAQCRPVSVDTVC